MATDRQNEANRKNAQQSTGPKTDEGKAASSQNAIRHGLTARGLIILPGHEQRFYDLQAELRNSLRPIGALQEALFTRVLESIWNLERCRLAEGHLCSQSGVDPLLDDQNEAKYARIHKYARQNETSLYKALHELGRLQTESEYRHQVCPLTEDHPATIEEFEQTPHALSEVCAYQKVIAIVTRERRAESRVRQNEANSRRLPPEIESAA